MAVTNGMYLRRDFKGGQMSRDMTLFVADDKKGYLITASEENQTLHLHELSKDYTGFTGKYYRIFLGGQNEGIALFKKGGIYYRYIWLPIEFDARKPILKWQDKWQIKY